MSNTGFASFELLSVEGRRIEDPGTEFTFFRMPEGTQFGDIQRLAMPPNPHTFRLPAFPQARALLCRVAPTLYRSAESAIFTLGADQTLPHQLTVSRRPQRWQARFTRWTNLPDSFDPLKKVLSNSGPLVVAEEEPRGFDGGDYDDVDNEPAILAKASLLNLYAKMANMIEPVGDVDNWFSYVRSILRIARERMIAVVDARMGDVVRFVRENSNGFRGEYSPAPADLHFKNFPLEYRRTFAPSDMFSIKSDESLGNVQLTLAPARDAAGNPVLLLDADIDENGELLKHFFDLLRHRFTGGTHPYDIHDLLKFANRQWDFGYTLHPAI